MFTVPVKLAAAATSLILGVLGSQPAGCAPGVMPDPTGKTPSCGTHVALKVALHGTGPAIEVDATTQCIHTPLDFNLALSLFRVTDAGPVQISDAVGRLTNSCQTIPVEGTTIDCIWWVAPCKYNGAYQGLAQIHGDGPDGTGAVEFFQWEEKSDVTTLRCR